MRLLGPLLRNVAVALALVALLDWWLSTSSLPLTAGQAEALAVTSVVGWAVELALLGFALAGLTRPLRRALAVPASSTEAEAMALATAAYRVPAGGALAAGLAGGLVAGGCAVALRQAGLPGDLAVAQAGVGLATAILGAMAAYALGASTVGRALERLGPRAEGGLRGTVRGKILLLCLGLTTVALLLLAATGYAHYRVDIDQEYLASAQRAQQSALRLQAGRSGQALVEQVWSTTAAPSALLGAGGAVEARSGTGEAPFEQAGAAPRTVRLSNGWLVASQAPGGGQLVSWLSEAPLQERRRAYWASLASTGLFAYLATALMAFVAARSITNPLRALGRAAGRIASGDLTATPSATSRDEVGLLASDFRRMAEGLKVLVVDVQAASRGVSHGAREASAIGERVRHGALGQHGGVVAVQAAVEAMEGSVAQVSRGVGSLSEYVSATTSAVGEMAAALEEVRRKGAELDRTMDTALEDVDHLAGAGREAEATLGGLEALAGHAAGTLAAVKASMTALERAAAESQANAGLVADMAERSGGVVEETVRGIETLRAAVSDAHDRIAALGRRSDDIDKVVDFISEVAGRTNLLSLNASIIASQAGEHGKAFAVVADQIRELAAQIARSTKSIGDIIHAVREDVEATASLIDRGDALAVEGVQLARNSLEALGKIQRTTALGTQAAGEIRAAVEVHAGSSRELSDLVESVAGGSRAVTGAVQLVGRSVAAVGSVSRSVNALAEQVAQALEEQAGQGRKQMDNLARLERMISDITRAVEAHNQATRKVRQALGDLSDTAGDHEQAVEGLAGVADRIGARARELADRVGRFRVADAPADPPTPTESR
jgi:methyl-accepting chemotaxis protein